MRSRRALAAMLAGLAVLAALTVHAVATADRARAAGRRPPVVSSRTVPRPSPAATVSPVQAAMSRIASLVAGLPPGSVSVAGYVPSTGSRFSYGATSGMITASVEKLQLLETLLLHKRATGSLLSTDEDADATAMIENSDNDAADAVFDEIGGTAGVAATESRLGISPATTVPGPDDHWGLTTSCATDQIRLLTDLVSPASPLDAAERAYALGLMTNVESDQRWGAPAVADPGSTPAVKDGWLAVDADQDRWAVNSDAVVTVHGQQVLLAVLTQHDSDEAAGITLVQALAADAVAALQ